jgi:hypothetical protein
MMAAIMGTLPSSLSGRAAQSKAFDAKSLMLCHRG